MSQANRPAVGVSPVEDIVADMRAGRMVILVDEEDRENEGDLVLGRRTRHARRHQFHGPLWPGSDLPDPHPRTLRNLAPAAHGGAQRDQDGHGIHGVDRSRHRRDHRHFGRRPCPHRASRCGSNARAEDLVQPGHIFPLQAVDGGVLMRAGHTEAGCDLAAMAGCTPAAVICEIMKDDGTMARLPDLAGVCRRTWAQDWHHCRLD
jgi:3,4-dihydroxy 2-butanone 4-phosphate synthase/GTP cyclohydrolase II